MPSTKFFERNEAHHDSLINMAPRPLARPPVSLSRGDEVPHIFIRESHQRARKILISSGKRLLQQNRHKAAERLRPHSRRVLEGKRTMSWPRNAVAAEARMHYAPLGRLRFGSASGEGRRFVQSELKYLLKHAPYLMPSALMRTAAKYLGYKIGRGESRIAPWLKYHLGLNRHYWRHRSP